MNLSKKVIKYSILSLVLYVIIKYPIKFMLLCLGGLEYFPLISGIYSCMFVAILCMLDSKDLPSAIKFISIFTWAVLFSFLLLNLFSNLNLIELISGMFSLGIPLALFADASNALDTSSSTSSAGNNTITSEGSTSKTAKTPRVKPDLTIKIGPETELDKDKVKIANCTHEKLSLFKITSQDEAENTVCDFSNSQEDENNQHKAFDGTTDNAFTCDDCFAVVCKYCVEEYSDSDGQ